MRADVSGSGAGSQLLENLAEIERTREHYWRRYPSTSAVRLRWRARAARHALHISDGDSVLELGAGTGLWTAHLRGALGAACRLTAAVFNDDLAETARDLSLPETEIALVSGVDDLSPESYDHIVGTAVLSHNRYRENLDWLYSLLSPGGGLLFFEANYWNPQVLAKAKSRRLAQWSGNAECQIALRKSEVEAACQSSGFTDVRIVPYDILHPRTPASLIHPVQSLAFVLEQTPVVRQLCGTLFIHGRRAGQRGPRSSGLTPHASLKGSVSVVVPCKNEVATVGPLVEALIATYDSYIREILIVIDPSADGTSQLVHEWAARDRRIRAIDRPPPPGVGRALRDGYALASGRYILSMDCDFAMLVPELRDLFDAVAGGAEGAIGSRFSHDSIVLDYPIAKLIGNRAFHVLVRRLLRLRVRDVSNNLKLYRSDLLRNLEITENGFAANAETGLGPLLAGYAVAEIPIAWINRQDSMGESAFRVLRVAPGYVRVLARALRQRKATRAG